MDEGDLLPMRGSWYKQGYRPNLSAFATGKCIGTVYVCVYYIDTMCIRAGRYLRPAIISANKCLVIL